MMTTSLDVRELLSDHIHSGGPLRSSPSATTAMILAVIAAMLLMAFPLRSQTVTYDTIPQKVLGPELWTLPIGGLLTLSQDGTKLLVASIADTTFYLVDAVNGTIIRRLPAVFWYDQVSTQYGADHDLTWLAVWGKDSLRKDFVYKHIDLTTGEIIRQQSLGTSINDVSRIHDRLCANRQLIEASTFRLITEFPEAGTGWFDDDRGLLYRGVNRQVQEIDAITGQVLRTIGVNSPVIAVRRPKNSQWIYCFSLQTDGGNKYNFVEAIHLETSERVTFWPNAGELYEGAPKMSTSTAVVGCSNDMAFSSGYISDYLPQPVWSYSVENLVSNVVLSPIFYFDGRQSPKEFEVDIPESRIYHCWLSRFNENAFITCNALIPNPASGVEEETTPEPTWLQVSSSELTIDLEESIEQVTIADLAGRVLVDLTRDALQQRPVRIPLDALPAGAYVCTVRLPDNTLSSSFTVLR